MRSDTDVTLVRRSEPWTSWPVYWTAVWVGVLAGLAAAVVIGLIGSVLGGWMASGERTTLARDRLRERLTPTTARTEVGRMEGTR